MIEPFLWPETILVTDGRTANARFLASRFKRDWQIIHDPFGGRTMCRLNESPLGHISEEHTNFILAKSRELISKEKLQRN